MIDDYSNPYDFTRPIKKQKFFAGREKELEEINHYLSLASSKNPSFHNLSLIGKRASGKTSLLNIIRNLAEEKGLLTVQVALNNESISNDALLFKEVFDGIFANGEKRGMFGGPKGSIYKSYRKIVETFDAKVEIPFSFGTAYLGLKDNPKHSISQHVLISDFKKFSAEAKSKDIPAIVLLFDECDLFTKNETILQKIRNVFENLDGFVLVFSGTENMFPNMENVFSPIPRFFKRITVENFKDKKETVDCILKPLSEDEKKYFDQSCINDIHSITSGSPYEINLISHYMYRRWKESKSKLIGLSQEILEDVLTEIERLYGTHYETVTKIKRCGKEQLRVLLALLEFPSITTNWLAEFVLINYVELLQETQIKSKKSHIISMIQQLKKQRLIQDSGNTLQFKDDSFDILFLKYFCASQGITNLKQLGFSSTDEPVINLANKLIQDFLLRGFQNYRVHSEFDRLTKAGNLQRNISLSMNFTLSPGKHDMVIYANPESQNEFYLGVENSIRFRTNVRWMKQGFVTQIRFDNADSLTKLKNRLQLLMKKLKPFGYEIILKDEIQWNLDGTILSGKKNFQKAIEFFEKSISLNPIFELPWMNKSAAYLNLGKFQQSLNSVNHALQLDPSQSEWHSLKGWILHKLNRNKESISSLEHAIDMDPKKTSSWLNFGNVLFNLKRYKQALEKYDHVLESENNETALYFQGMCFSNLGKNKQAMENFDLILKDNPKDSNANFQKAILLQNEKDFEQSLKILEKIESEWKENSLYLELRSLALYALGQIDEAIKWINMMIERSPSFGGGWYNRACYYAKKELISKSLADLKKSIELDPRMKKLAKKESDFSKIRNSKEFIEILNTK